MSAPNPYNAVARLLRDEPTVGGTLLPQTPLAGLLTPPVFALNYPRKDPAAAATSLAGHDWSALLHQQAIRLILVTASGRVPSGGDRSRAPWGRPRMDVQCYGRTDSEAMELWLACEAYLKGLSNARAALTAGTVLIRDVTIEGGPIEFPDPETEAPEAVGIVAASAIQEFVA